MASPRVVGPVMVPITITARKGRGGRDVPGPVLPATILTILNNTESVLMRRRPGTGGIPFLRLRIRRMPGGLTWSGGVVIQIATTVTSPQPITGAMGDEYPVANLPAATYTDNRFHSGAPAVLAGRFSFTFGAESSSERIP